MARKRAYDSQWSADNTDRHRMLQRRSWLKRYGLTLEGYDRMLEEQGSTCAICPTDTDKNGGNLSVDHCHKTGKVRGLLCKTCNRDIGRIERYPEGFRKYLEEIL